jgi:hypothetical protein
MWWVGKTHLPEQRFVPAPHGVRVVNADVVCEWERKRSVCSVLFCVARLANSTRTVLFSGARVAVVVLNDCAPCAASKGAWSAEGFGSGKARNTYGSPRPRVSPQTAFRF